MHKLDYYHPEREAVDMLDAIQFNDLLAAGIITDQGTAPRNRSASGYGNKIPTWYMLKDPRDNRTRRIYAICWSNCCSLYVLKKGKRLFLW